MDSYHHQSNWYPSSSPPPPPPGGGYSHPNPNPNPHLPYPHIPHHQQWPPPSENYLHHQNQQFQTPPPPPPYHGHAPAGLPPRYSVHPPPVPSHMQQQQQQQHNYPPMPPIPPRPHHSFPPYQARGNPSWTQHQGSEYPERSIPYNNEEDWAARARAWAASKSGTENHHMQSHFAPIGRPDGHSYAYHDQYQQAVDSRTDVQQPSHPQSSVQHLPNTATDPQRQVNNLHVSAPFNSGTSYDLGYNAGDEAIATNPDHMASHQKNYVPSSSIYEQEVSYSYSSAPGNRGAVNQNKGSNVPLPLPMASSQEGHHMLSSLPLQMSSAEQPPFHHGQLSSAEQPHFSHHGQRADFLPNASDRPLEFESRPSSDYESHEKLSYGHSGPTGVMGVMDHDAHVSPISSWNTAAATGVGYSQIPLAPAGTQFDSSFIPQVHPAPIFGRIPPPSFQPNLPPVTFGLGPGSSLHHSAGFPGDTNGGLNLSERPKKAAVPNWLREEIIKKKAVLPSTVPMQPTVNSLYSIGPDDADKSLRRADQADSRSINSNKSEDEEDDEEDVEATRSAAINQEIKRVLTEVLLKVTDELFDEIASKVLDEEHIVDVEENAVVGKQKVSSPPAISTSKASAKIIVPFKMENDKENGFAENSSTSSPGRDILGLGNYASDDSDDDGGDEIRSSSLLSSGNKVGAAQELENNDKSFQNDLRSEGNIEHLNGPTQKKSASSYEGNHITEKGSSAADNLKYEKTSLGASTVCEETVLPDSGKVNELPSVNGNSYQYDHNVDEKTGRGHDSTSGHANRDKFINRDYQDRECKSILGPDKNPVVTEIKDNMYKTRREISDKSDSVSHEDRSKLKDKSDKSEKAKERAGNRSSDQRPSVKESDSRRSSKHNSSKDDKKEAVKDKREKDKEAGERKRERGRDEDDRSTRDSKSSSRYTSRRSPTPGSRGKNSKDNSVSFGSASGDEPSDNSRKRMQQSVNSGLSPSPTKSRKRQVSRSPPSKHSHRRHSPYPSSERRRRRSRSISPIHQKRSSAHK